MQKEIDDTYQQLINELQESWRKLSQEAAADLQENWIYTLYKGAMLRQSWCNLRVVVSLWKRS